MTHTTCTTTTRSTVVGGLLGRLTWVHALILLAVLRLVVSAAIWRAGMLAVSDDDYARVTIAERFAVNPRLDPTETSWLPFPFWWMGGIMRLLGNSLATARVCAEAAAVIAGWLLFAGGRAVGMSVGVALAGSLLATVLPVAAVLGCAPVPELLTAALCGFALLAVGHPIVPASIDHPPPYRTLATPSARALWELLAVIASLAASLSRYEAWPAGFVVAVTLLVRASPPETPTRTVGPATLTIASNGSPGGWRTALPRARRVLMALLAISGPLGWLIHQQVAHGDALRFLRRVASYRAALGGAGAVSGDLWRYLVALVSSAPALTLSVLVLAWIGPARLRIPVHVVGRPSGSWAPAVAGAVTLLAFLVAGAWLGGVPTHHAGRMLLLAWLLAAMAFAGLAARMATRWALGWGVMLALVSALHFPQEIDGGLDRRKEEAIGRVLADVVPANERVLIATDDYGYFAIMAAFGRPLDASVDRTHDPRKGVEASALASAEGIRQRLRDEHASWLVVPGRIRVDGLVALARNDGFAVYSFPKYSATQESDQPVPAPVPEGADIGCGCGYGCGKAQIDHLPAGRCT